MQILFFLLICIPFVLVGNPVGATIEAGSAVISPKGALLQIETSDRAILNWDSFSINTHEMTQFLQPSASSAVLNRVSGGEISMLLGQLQANGQVYLINPNGIVIGKEAVINTAALFASTLQIQNDEFLAKGAFHLTGNSFGKIENLGTISLTTGSVSLFARHIENRGTIEAPHVSLGAGSEFLVQPTGATKMFIRPGSDSLLSNEGKIEGLVVELQSDGASALAINQKGLVQAGKISKEGGKVFLRAPLGKTIVSGKIEAPQGRVEVVGDVIHLLDLAEIDVSHKEGGGTILVGGDYQGNNPEVSNANLVWAGPETSLRADALEKGDGGKVILWGNHANFHYGSVSARGGPLGGDGGLVEISGKLLDFSGMVDTLAPLGKTGTLLLDPTDIVIDSVVMPTSGSFSTCPPSPINYEPDMSTSNYIYIPDLITQLGLCNVVIQASGDGVTNGTITVSGDIDWSGTTNDLTLSTSGANSSVIINGALTSNEGNLTVSAEGVTVATSQYGIQINNNLTTQSGNFTFSTDGNIYVNSTLPNVTIAPTTGSVLISSTGTTASIQCGDGATCSGGPDLAVTASGGGTVTFNAAGPINICGPLTVEGGAQTTFTSGASITNTNTITKGAGSLDFSAGGNVSLQGALTRTGAGNINFQALGNIQIFAPIDCTLGSGDILMNAGLDINSSGNITTSGTSTFTASRAILSNTSSFTNLSGDFLFSAGSDIIFPLLTILDVQDGQMTFQGGRDLSMYTQIVITTGLLNLGVCNLKAARDVSFGGDFIGGAKTYVTSGRDIYVTSTVFGVTIGDLFCLAGRDFIVPTSTPITANGGNLTFAVDVSSGAKAGPGLFRIADNCTINTSAGFVSFYASEPIGNSFPALINGVPLANGNVFCDVVYPEGSPLAPFSIYYKLCTIVSPLQEFMAALASTLNNPSNNPYFDRERRLKPKLTPHRKGKKHE